MAKKLFLAALMRHFDTEQQLMLVEGGDEAEALCNAIEIQAPGFFKEKPKEEDYKPSAYEIDEEEALEDAQHDYECELESWNDTYEQFKRDIQICGVNEGVIFLKTGRHSHRID